MGGGWGVGGAISKESSILLHNILSSSESLSFFSRQREDLLDSFIPILKGDGSPGGTRRTFNVVGSFLSPPTVAGMLTTRLVPLRHIPRRALLSHGGSRTSGRRTGGGGGTGRLGGSYALHGTLEKFLTALSRATPASCMSNLQRRPDVRLSSARRRKRSII